MIPPFSFGCQLSNYADQARRLCIGSRTASIMRRIRKPGDRHHASQGRVRHADDRAERRTPETPAAKREGPSRSRRPTATVRSSPANSGRERLEAPPGRRRNREGRRGDATLHIMTADGRQSYVLKAAMVAIVPQGHVTVSWSQNRDVWILTPHAYSLRLLNCEKSLHKSQVCNH